MGPAHERTLYRAIGTEDAAVSGLRAHDDAAICALVKVKTAVRRDSFRFGKAAVRASYQRFQRVDDLNVMGRILAEGASKRHRGFPVF